MLAPVGTTPPYQLQQAPGPAPGAQPQAYFRNEAFEALIRDKGYPVQIDQALECPCAGENTGSALSNCRSCGGLGWTFLPGARTTAVLSGMGQSKRQAPWTELTKGTASVTVLPTDKLAYMDRLTFLHATTLFSQRLYPHPVDEDDPEQGWEVYTTYPVKELAQCLAYDGPQQPLRPLLPASKEGNRLRFAAADFPTPELRQPQLTVRYHHHPVYHVLDIPRDLLEAPTLTQTQPPNGRPTPTELPLHAIAQRAHFIFGRGRPDELSNQTPPGP